MIKIMTGPCELCIEQETEDSEEIAVVNAEFSYINVFKLANSFKNVYGNITYFDASADRIFFVHYEFGWILGFKNI